ncbi:TIGR01621 family pseudouridine synthase [Thalassolituus sp. LLYu03]|uniref:TIGR01621 family pseudouridine synthase n=1 Tax=Thalassolituus sp. LLYu03 TaxID=3421656 RepID=UPI003D2DBA9B
MSDLPHIPVVADHPDWLAVYKPEGIGMHSESGEAGLVVLVAGQQDRPLWPVHRLDKVTSGLLLLAKNAEAAARLSALFAEHRIEKVYLAQAQGKPLKKQGWIKGDMEKSRNGSYKLARSQSNPAITRFVSHFDECAGKRLYLLRPFTGKTHQLRVALKSLGCPIEGDERYGQASDRTYLHALALRWTDDDGEHRLIAPPTTGVWGDLPDEWQDPWAPFHTGS